MADELCPCGQPLHYTIPENQRAVQKLVVERGPNVRVTIGGRSWLVSRHFIALHGFMAEEAELLADLYDFEEVP